MWNRDSWAWTIAALSALVGYLLTQDGPPSWWDYKEWLNFAAFVVAWLSGKMASSPQPGAKDSDNLSKRGNMGAWLLPLLLASSVLGASACSGAIKPPVITGEDQAQVRAAATKVLAGIEVAGVIVRDGRQLVSDLHAAGLVPVEVRSAVNQAVIAANDVVQDAITEIASATRIVTVDALVQKATAALFSVADVLERQSDSRVQTAGRFLRTAIGAVTALLGGAR